MLNAHGRSFAQESAPASGPFGLKNDPSTASRHRIENERRPDALVIFEYEPVWRVPLDRSDSDLVSASSVMVYLPALVTATR